MDMSLASWLAQTRRRRRRHRHGYTPPPSPPPLPPLPLRPSSSHRDIDSVLRPHRRAPRISAPRNRTLQLLNGSFREDDFRHHVGAVRPLQVEDAVSHGRKRDRQGSHMAHPLWVTLNIAFDLGGGGIGGLATDGGGGCLHHSYPNIPFSFYASRKNMDSHLCRKKRFSFLARAKKIERRRRWGAGGERKPKNK